ncbi:phosphotransferase family protein [Streptomyces endophyticus]|uniref:Aminoglycoside phosphotransferase family protein n=1 Tax=Streptomyces endophyticus TaxID=714166 RepID=A0ABU6EWM7_9ACTN|nr:aminoglycoside phosphotransferase family protein [Streptomyces endophyticus]MEB8336140.1 aminoglycoside phosphotransferase family protein [Streptomyces endophyticus]
MRPLKHGYTNRTLADGTVVKKSYAGPDAELRLRRERTLLPHLKGQLPVPPVLGTTATTLKLGFLAGVPGQELLDAGHAAEVMASCGRLLRRIQDLTPPVTDLGTRRTGEVLVHGDFGPNNLLLDPATYEVTAVVDWEFAHFGTPVEDLAWCEWIVRTHHPAHRAALDHFFRSYGGEVPPWPVRRAAMLARCEELRRFCERWKADGPGARQWRERAAVTAGWQE